MAAWMTASMSSFVGWAACMGVPTDETADERGEVGLEDWRTLGSCLRLQQFR